METTSQFGYIGNRRREVRPQATAQPPQAPSHFTPGGVDVDSLADRVEQLEYRLAELVSQQAGLEAVASDPEPGSDAVEAEGDTTSDAVEAEVDTTSDDTEDGDDPVLTATQQQELQDILNSVPDDEHLR